jgi:hypothetical protein
LEAPTWQVALLGTVVVIDLVMFIGLVREEIHDWRARRRSGRNGS